MKNKIEPGTKVRLKDYSADDIGGFGERAFAEEKLAADLERLTILQDKLFAENKRALLVVLQAMDTGGKDGTVKHIFSGCNPTGCDVTSFKVPSVEEADHDFLWRIYQAVPNRGNIGIFNRSHYEDVLVVRVHEMVPEGVWKKRYDQINRFEQLLVENGTTILKFFLHLSKDEQRNRFLDRIEHKEKHWKFSSSDITERKYWNEYQHAYEETLINTSTKIAPWYIIPADDKLNAHLLIGKIILEKLKVMNPCFPKTRTGPER